jgi:hypothetical protein
MLKFEFSVQETNLILAALRKQPMEAVEQIVGKIQFQANEQLNPKKNEESKEKKK